MEPWVAVLNRIAEVSAAPNVILGAIDRRAGTVIFAYSGGTLPREAANEVATGLTVLPSRLIIFVKPPSLMLSPSKIRERGHLSLQRVTVLPTASRGADCPVECCEYRRIGAVGLRRSHRCLVISDGP
jgi:hypothetical protein